MSATSSKISSMAVGELVKKYAKIGLDIARCRYEISSDSELANKRVRGDRHKGQSNILTFSQMTNSLTVDRRAVVINVGHQKLAEVPHDRLTNTIMGNPFNNGFGLNVA